MTELVAVNGEAQPRAPAGLGAAGKATWRAVLGDFKVRDDELIVMVIPACRLSDEIARMEEELAEAPVIVAGSKGQDRPNPLLAELRSLKDSGNTC